MMSQLFDIYINRYRFLATVLVFIGMILLSLEDPDDIAEKEPYICHGVDMFDDYIWNPFHDIVITDRLCEDIKGM